MLSRLMGLNNVFEVSMREKLFMIYLFSFFPFTLFFRGGRELYLLSLAALAITPRNAYKKLIRTGEKKPAVKTLPA